MGRIKTKLLKSKTREIMDKHGDKMDTDFEKNKQVVSEHTEYKSKETLGFID